MKKRSLSLLVWLAAMLLFPTHNAVAESDGKISHVVLVWLKESGNQQIRHEFVQASQQLNGLPGVVNRHVGVVVPSDRVIVDDTFDVAITVTLENKKALQAYIQHPKHKKILEQQLKPLVNRVVAYDFMSE
ncbi:Dabb family protein [Methylomarinum vadi]|uniref:Dabb family protein n=1 Tax=Methylomarinum vadi TaxID=438855 RepID=UPI00068DF778|nr:Dabb family protein [Methylomarinum vadi]